MAYTPAKTSTRLILFSILMASLIFIMDITLPWGSAAGVPYVALILVSLYSPNSSFTIILAIISTLLTFLGYFLSPTGELQWIEIVNRVLALFAIWATALISLERKRADQALLESQERFVIAVDGANDGIWDWDIKDNRVFYSARWKDMLGWEKGLIGNTIDEWFKRIHPDDLKRVMAQVNAHIEGETEKFESELRMLYRDGTYRWMLIRGVTLRDSTGKGYRMAGSMTDITPRKRAEERLRRQAIFDSATGLYNRQHLMKRLEASVHAAKRYGHPMCLCLCDLDYFKSVNDIFGHRAGDKVLGKFGRIVQNELRSDDLAGRYGGDEFCIIFPNTRAGDAFVSTERIRHRLEKQSFANERGASFSITATFGIADLDPETMNEKDLIEAADQTLYAAKEEGRNRAKISQIPHQDPQD